jgi:cytochrome c
MKTILAAAMAGLLMLSLAQLAQADIDKGKAEKLAQEKGCTACHGIDKKVIGPAYKDVAQKYKGNKDALATLTKKVKDGGSGVWGPIPMPPNAGKVSDDEVKLLVEWVLAL